VTAFVDDVLVGMEAKEGHGKVVEEVLKRLEENNLYIKPEKYMWKVKKVLFLGVVIGEGGDGKRQCGRCAEVANCKK